MFASSEGNLNICLAYKWIYALRMTYDICKNAILFACKGMQSLGATSNSNSIYRGKYILGTQRHKGGAIVSLSCQLLAGIVAEMDAQLWSCTSLFKFSDLKRNSIKCEFPRIWHDVKQVLMSPTLNMTYPSMSFHSCSDKSLILMGVGLHIPSVVWMCLIANIFFLHENMTITSFYILYSQK